VLKFAKIVLAGASFLTILFGASASRSQQAAPATHPDFSDPDAQITTISPLPNGQWTQPAGDYANTRYSPLNQITTANVKNLKVFATYSTGIPHGHEGQPLVINNTMYIVTPYPNDLIAIDLKNPTGPIKWKFQSNPDPRSQGRACCDTVNRGAAYADGKIVYNLLDANTVAVDAKTGKQVWRTKVGDVGVGETVTMAPLIVKDKVFVGNSGGEFGVRGKLVALDLKTGKELWRAYSQGPDSDVRIGPDFKPYYEKDQGKDLGVKSWPPDKWKQGGGTIWGWISYDPQLNLIYYGTGNPGVWDPDLRPGDNKWSITIFARNADTGYARWAYQLEPHDGYDYDEIMENILVDMNWKGRTRKVLLHPGRNGFMFVIDRETGELLSAEKFVPTTNWAFGYDLKTGLPIKNPDKETRMGMVVRHICPSSTGGKEFVPSSISPRTGLLYIPAHNTCMDYEGVNANYIPGTPYLGASVKMYQGPGGFHGSFVAWDVKNAREVWDIKDPQFPVYSGVLSTGGDVVFYGTLEGWFRAVNAKTGELLWQYKTPSGIVGDPITYIGPDGKQYVAIYSGIGGWMGAIAQPSISIDDDYAALGAVGAMKEIKNVSPPGNNVYIFGF
jgi:PQQ-dependent dehydrogenase (methanol/ethanol family)